MSHLSYEGQSKVDYCLECCEKHGQTARVLMREAIQRCETSGCDTDGVKEKVKGVVEELMGIENDSTSVMSNERVDAINNVARLLWKDIYASGAELGHANNEKLKEIKIKLDGLAELVYKTREIEGECPTCKIKVEAEPKPRMLEPSQDYGSKVAEERRKFLEEIKGSMRSE